MKFLKNILFTTIYITTNSLIAQPIPMATFTGIAKATFTNPAGGGVSTGVGTDFFTWGGWVCLLWSK